VRLVVRDRWWSVGDLDGGEIDEPFELWS